MLNRLIHWSINNRFLVVVVAAAILVATLFVARGMDIDVLPDFAPPEVTIQTEAPGLVAEEVEALVSLPLESAINGTPGVTTVKSLSMAGISKVTVYFQDGTNVYTDRQLVNEKVQMLIGRLPVGVGVPTMEPVMSELGDVMKLGLVSEDMSSMELRTFADWNLRNRLLATPGVARVVIFGGDQKQFQVLIDPERMRSAGVTLSQVNNAVRTCNAVAPAGFIVTPERQFTIRGMLRAKNTSDIAEAVVTSRNGVPIKVKHVAQVEMAPAFPVGDAVVNGKRGLEVVVTKQPWIGTLAVTARLQSVLHDVEREQPQIHFIYIFRQADFIEQSIDNMLSSIWVGGAIVVAVLLLFLFNWRTSIISLTAIPISLICGLCVIKAMGGSINTMTLGGMAIAVGEVVDDAVVDVENVFRRLRENRLSVQPKPPLEVIFHACREVRGSVVYATFVVALVFLPVFSLTGVEGRLFGQLGISYVAATISSLLVALTVTPALSAYLLSRPGAVPQREPAVVRLVKKVYSGLLHFVLERSGAIVAAGIVLLILSIALIPSMGHAFLPDFEEKDLMIPTSAMPGQSLDASTRIGLAVEESLHKMDIAAVGQRIGRAELDEDAAAASFSEFDVRLRRDQPLDETSQRIRKVMDQVPGITYEIASFLNDHINDVLSGGTQADLVIKIFGPDTEMLRQLSAETGKLLKQVPGMVDVTPEQQILIPEVDVRIDRQKAARYGITSADVSHALETLLGGPVVSQVLQDGKLFGLRIWGDSLTRGSLDEIDSLPLDTASGAKIPLWEVADVSVGQGANAIVRENVNRRITVLANIRSKDLVGTVDEARRRIDRTIKVPSGYYFVYSGQYSHQQSSAVRLGVVSLVALAGILLLLSQGLGGFRAALLVTVNLPLAAIGGLFAVALTGNVLSIGSLIGFISLFGISTRNSLLMVSHINQLVRGGKSFQQALYHGALDRIVPVLMTALTAALGMLPLAICAGSGKEIEQPLAIVIVGGLLSSTILTLLVIPAIYRIAGEAIIPPNDDN